VAALFDDDQDDLGSILAANGSNCQPILSPNIGKSLKVVVRGEQNEA